jgi:hypothetical protein
MVSSGVAEVRMRAYFSSYHLWAAEHFTRFAKEIEDAHTGSPEFNITHRAYVTNAILSAVASSKPRLTSYLMMLLTSIPATSIRSLLNVRGCLRAYGSGMNNRWSAGQFLTNTR